MTPQEVTAAVDIVLSCLRPADFVDEAINWADLHCCDADQYVDGRWHVVIEEADPTASSLQAEVKNQLLQKWQIRADVDAEW